MAKQIGLLVISFILFSRGIHLIAGEECKFEHKYKCGIQDCNCRYVNQNGVRASLYRRFLAMFLIQDNEGQVCDKCDVFCSEEKHINCQHGACDKQNGCICRDCWSGETCSKYQNRQPEFKESLYVAEIKEDTSVRDEILKVSASDPDLETCVDKYNCPCGRVKYSISKGNEDGLFNINPESGVISLAKKPSGQYDPISLTILAENEGDLNTVEDNQSDKPLATVVITVKSDDDGGRERRSLHHRARRSVTTYDSLKITFEAVTNETFFAAGCTINYRLYLVQNQSASPQQLSSISVQLSSDNLDLSDGYLVNISNVVNTAGSIDRLDAGTVQFNISDSLESNGYMEIKFNGSVREASDPLALLQVSFTMNATGPGQVTYGPKYSSELYTTYPEIKLARTTKGVVEVETTLDYNVNVTLPDFNYFTFILVITTIVNDFRFLGIENVQLGKISSSVQAQNQNPSPMMYTGADDNITSRVVLDFGKITISNRDQSANTIKLSFSVKVNDHHLLENASRHSIGIGSYAGSDMLGVTQDFIEIFKDEPYLFAEIEAIGVTDPEVKEYFINDQAEFSWKVKHGNGSYETAENVKILFYFPTSVVNLNNNVTNTSGLVNGSTVQTTDSASGREVLTFTPTGDSLSKADTLGGIIKVKVSETVTPLADLNIEIQIRYQTSKREDRPIRTYKPNPGYIAGAPSFSLSADPSNTSINIGQFVEITLKVMIRRMTLYGNVFVYLSDRNINSTIMRFVTSESFTNISYGANIEATNFINAKATYNSTIDDKTYYNSAELDLGLIKNKDIRNIATGESENNTVMLTFKVVLEDNVYVEDLANYSINIGIKSSEQTVWVGQIVFTANVTPNRQPRLQIIPLSNGSDSLVQGSVVEYNFTVSHKDNSDAHAMDVEIVWMLPVYTKFLKVNRNKHQLTFTKLGDNVMFTLNKLEFGEKPFVSFSVEMDPENTRTKPGKNYAVTPVALTYKNKQTHFEPLIPMSVAFIVPEPHTPNIPASVAPEFYNRGYLVDMSRSTVYMCSVSSRRDKPSCFWTNTKGATWQAVHVSVINIIGIDKLTKTLYGIGNNKNAYMKYLSDEEKWYSILPDTWKEAMAAFSVNNTIKIEDGYDHESDPEKEKQRDMGNGEIWGANKLGVFHSSSNGTQWTRKACWDCFH